MRVTFSTSAALALIAALGFGSLATTPASAGQRHWFYQNYDRYDDRAYYDDEGYDDDEDEYVVYAPPPRRIRRERLRRKLRQQAALRRQNRLRRQGRQRLDDARRNGQNGQYEHDDRYVAPRLRQTSRPAPQKRLRLSYVPLPRTKPYHLVPQVSVLKTATNPQTGRRITIDNGSKPSDFDQRPVWKANPAEKTVSKKDIEVAKLPKINAVKPKINTVKNAFAPAATKPKTKTTFKPIRIKVVKTPTATKPRKPRKPRKLTANQLSCDKAKTIVSDFGFSDITPRTCTGTVYDFNAKRDGKPYSVKVSSLSGELKGVKKIK